MKIRPENIVRFLLLIKQAMIKVMGFEYTFFLVRFCLQLAFILPSAHLHHSIYIPFTVCTRSAPISVNVLPLAN